MQKKEFIRQLNELVPRPDPVTTEALYRFDRECAETEYIDMLTALRVVARNFGEETLQGAYEVIQHQNAALPSELFAAAVYLFLLVRIQAAAVDRQDVRLSDVL